MFFINKDIELTPMLLGKMINRFNLERKPYLSKMKHYYDGAQAILNKSYADTTKPCSHPVVNFCQDISDSYCGYIASPGYITYASDVDIEDVMNVLRYNDYMDEDSDFLLNALIYGTSAELMYTDEDAKIRFKLINPEQCFGIYDDSLTNDLLYFVRWYKANEWDETDLYNVDLYTDNTVRHYTMNSTFGALNFIGEEQHYFGQCPANIFSLPDEKSIFDSIINLQDVYNELLGSEVDDFSAFCDAYLAIYGAELDKDSVAFMKENRVLIMPDGSKVEWLTKDINDGHIENMLTRIQDSIYRIAHCPDFSSEKFVGGVSSGIAIKYRLTGMETTAGRIVAKMRKALQRRIEIICGIASLKLGEEVFRDIQISFKRNIPEDFNTYATFINTLKGSVSDKTLLAQLPFIEDVDAELEALNEQKQANLSLYSFGHVDDEDEE